LHKYITNKKALGKPGAFLFLKPSLPKNLFVTLSLKDFISSRKGLGAKETTISRQWTWMGRFNTKFLTEKSR
jgi:hypothetical protein